MGATNFLHEIEAYSAREGFDMLIADANQRHGTESYNGSINTCSMGGCTLRFDKHTKTNEQKGYKHIEDKDYGNKWEADYVDLGIIGYDLVSVKKQKVEYGAEFKLKFVVVKLNFFSEEPTKYFYDKKTDADAKALELSLSSDCNYGVKKEYVNVKKNGTTFCTKIVKEVKRYKTKPNLKDMKNKKLHAVHKYIFYGWASC